MSTTIQPAPLMTRLNHDWSTVYVGREHTFGALGLRTCDELLAEIRGTSGADQDALLYELLSLARRGDRTAERVLVQALIPTAQRMAHRVRSLADMDRADRVGFAIGMAWEVISTYPLRLRQRVHANLSMGLLKRLTPKKTQNETTIMDRTFAVSDEVLEVAAGDWTGPEKSIEVLAADLFTWAVDTGVLARDETALLARVALGDEKQTDIAAELGVSVDCINQRVARSRRRLKAAYAENF